MSAVRAVALALSLLAPSAAPAAPDTLPATKLELAPGGKRVLKLKHVERIAIGDPAVAEVKPVGADALEVSGQAAGQTEVQVWAQHKRHRYQVTVK